MINFGRNFLFWSNLAKKSGFDQFWPEKLVSVDFSRKSLRRFWQEKLGFDKKNSFGLIWAHLGSFGLIRAHSGLEIVFYFFDLNTDPCGSRTQDLNPGVKVTNVTI